MPHPLFMMAALFAAAALIVGMLLPIACRMAHRLDFLDRPGGRKKHEDDIPPVGGLVIFPVFMLLALLTGDAPPSFIACAGAVVLLLAVGGLDDRFALPARIKFITQFIAAFIIVLIGGVRVQGMGDIFGFGPLWLGWMAIPFTVVAIVLLINAINLMDGLDGLAGGLGFIVCFWLWLCALSAGDQSHATVLAIMMGALIGFLYHNMRHPWRAQARVFMGDAGSLSLGLVLAWVAIDMAGHPDQSAIMPMTVAWLLALPIMDTCGQFARRVSQGRHPFDPDHNHFHHHFVTAGLSVRAATASILLIAFLYGLLAVAAEMMQWPQAALTYPWIGLLFAHIFMSMRPRRFRKLIQRIFHIKGEE
ncbi:MAG: undecaprenyl/decaprenyl-phosphate alpha-N-acetylglucosaminyl 1-phosphate transferase [Micavibrio aeruginosavorus]|uniref:Undecaprenyl/decaprenyl-phosphate alpha-N-acetylglucosaminyl 1-phosphate transferase n=1 Tax=Micavibrio aeruginosavorus TaxID=349221 RepID=A0A7T5R3M9_9BACT|nr:MAG: undecaprenyl/decaprenyl-phosphate alpha-N-acetylglucosaminyl 1-phosphate transferase [Micavibrio aeruginosavorus]